MPVCAVWGCKSRSGKSANANIHGTHHFFKVSKNKDTRKVWQKAIGRNDLCEKHYICEKHFLPNNIITKKVIRGPDGIIYSEIPYKIPRLESGAVPSLNLREEITQTKLFRPILLQDHNYINTNLVDSLVCRTVVPNSTKSILREQIEKETVTHENDILEEDRQLNVYQNKERKELETERTNNAIFYANDRNDVNQNEKIAFEELRSNLQSIHTPIFWTKHEGKTDCNEHVIYFTHTIVRSFKDSLKLISVKELIVKDDMRFIVNVMGQSIDLKLIGIDTEEITNIATLEQILQLLEIHNVCTGLATDLEIDCSVAKRDCANNLRHNECTLLLPMGSMCTKCRNIMKMINKKKKIVEINERSRIERNRSQRIHSSSQKSKNSTIKIQKYASK